MVDYENKTVIQHNFLRKVPATGLKYFNAKKTYHFQNAVNHFKILKTGAALVAESGKNA